jgi:hypothetical protein
MIAYTLQDGALYVGNASQAIAFPLAVEEVVPFDTILVVRIKATSAEPRNVYGVDATGKIVWQIAELPLNKLRDTYLSIKKESETTVVGYYSLGFLIHFDAVTGKVVSGDFVK